MPQVSNPRFSIPHAVAILRNGGVIAFPTETTYGLGCDPRNAKAVKQIYAIKGREFKKPLLLVSSSITQVRKIAHLDQKSLALTKKYWPGPLTLVLPIREPSVLVPGVAVQGEVAIRVSSSPVVQALTREFGFPITATSANLSGEPDCRSAKAVRQAFGDKVDFILDGGILPKQKPSTVARMKKDGSIEVIRAGAIRL